MAFPDMQDLEFIVAYLNHTPQWVKMGREKAHAALMRPSPRLSGFPEGIQQIARAIAGDMLSPPQDSLHFFDRVARLPRLAEGTYTVHVPEGKTEINGFHISIPEAEVSVEHRRTYHSQSVHEPSRLDPENEDGDYSIDYDTERPGHIKQTINVHLETPFVSTVYSDFRIVLPEPEGWSEAHEFFETIFFEDLGNYQRERIEKIRDMRKKHGEKKIQEEIMSDDLQKVEEHEEFIFAYLQAYMQQWWYHSVPFARIQDNYSVLLHNRPASSTFQGGISMGVDAHDRVLSWTGVVPELPLTIGAFEQGRRHHIEALPFNDVFHETLEARLRSAPKKRRDGEMRAWELLRQAYDLIDQGNYGSAIPQAAAAFEATLNDFLLSRGVVYQDDIKKGKYGLHLKLGILFDKAVRNDITYQGIESDIFERKLKEKILPLDNSPAEKMQGLRNALAHGDTIGDIGHDPGFQLALVACTIYNEAISYIQEEGWNVGGPRTYASDVQRWMFPEINGFSPRIRRQTAEKVMRAGLADVMKYMQPLDIARLKAAIPSDNPFRATIDEV